MKTIAQLIDDHWSETRNEPPRMHLGASLIGTDCERALWYGFRWASLKRFEGRLLRLFDRGHSEEARFIRDLKAIGMAVYERDPETGRQFQFSDHGGHFGGSLDGIGMMPNEPAHVLEFKTSAEKPFLDMKAKGVRESKPLHFAQMQKYMGWASITHAIYMMVNKNTDELYTEIVEYDAQTDQAISDKALRIIEAQKPPAKISTSPGHYACKWCDHYGTCHDEQPARMSCRTCISATPKTDGDGGWHCEQYNTAIPENVQRSGCPDHRYIPDLLPFGEMPEAKGRDITYTLIGSDRQFTNGPRGPNSYDSLELQELNGQTVCDPGIELLRENFDGRVTTVTAKDEWVDDIPF